ncbi:hypothetical protein PoB_002327000 [Plakobranchus ocellatus]|uniref:Uncharacterized protein n=1 Tax=Plakobranchus ocellatus TaxID=259542 RepID=A0AAV3ZNP4_9GAST|nr:hypothetical protein PoB_002327000 [Plakobranchus ocellatus]
MTDHLRQIYSHTMDAKSDQWAVVLRPRLQLERVTRRVSHLLEMVIQQELARELKSTVEYRAQIQRLCLVTTWFISAATLCLHADIAKAKDVFQ